MKKLLVSCSALACFLMASCLNLSRSGEVQEPKANVENNGVSIAYTDTGKGDTTLLFVHGWCINKTYWDNQVAYFSNQYRVVTMDLPGFGNSGKNRKKWDTQTFGSDVDAVIEQLHLKNVILVGHSMAGDIVVEAATHNPKAVIAIVGIDNFKNAGIPNPDSIQAKKQYAQAMAMMKHNFKSVAYPYINQQLFSKTTDSAVRKRVLGDAAKADTVIATACMEQDNFDEATELVKAGKPLYLINSDVTPTDITGLQLRHIPVQVFYVHGTGHYPMIEKPQEFNQQLTQVMKNVKR